MDNWLTGSRHQLSDQGLIGGSVDAQERSRAITGYLQGKSSLNEARQTAEQNARNAIERRRASSEDLIRTGGSPILDAAFQQQVADVKEANQQIPYNALGDLFRNEAQVYSTTQQENRRKEGQSNLTNSMNQGSGGKYS